MIRIIRFLCLVLLATCGPVHLVRADEGARPLPNFNMAPKDDSTPVHDALADLIKDLRYKAVRGDADAQEQLGEHYEDGEGVKQNFSKAADWYERAANQGNPKGQNKLGYLYLRGLGVTQNYSEAYFWITLSSGPLDKNTTAIREEIKKALPPEKLSEQQKRITEWAPEEEDIDPLDIVDDEGTDEQDEADENLCKGYDIAGRTAPRPRRVSRQCRKAYNDVRAVCFNITSCADCEASIKNLIVKCRKPTIESEPNPAYTCELDSDCHLIETNYCEVTYEPLSVNRMHLQEVRKARAIPVIDCARPPELRAKYRAVCVEKMCQVKKSD